MRHGTVQTGLSVGAIAAATYLALFDPAGARWIPPCPFHAATGLDCPGCGTLRGLHALLNVDLVGAIDFNPLMVVAIVVAMSLLAARMTALPVPRFLRAHGGWIALGTVVVFWVLRNIPYHPFTHLGTDL
jgi:hypothetical protein